MKKINDEKLLKIEDVYQLNVDDMTVEFIYAKKGKSFNECMLEILKEKL